MQNHLFIGLGGQGGRTLGELRKVMAQRARDLDALGGLGVRIEFLAIDSSDDVRNDRRSWTDFGTDLALPASDWLILERPGRETIGTLALRPDIAPWLGDRGRVEGFLAQGQIQGANQRRRFGRLLFAYNASAIRTAVAAKVGRLTEGRHYQCAFHLFATLAGGTGSGGLVDLAVLIRSRYPESDSEGFPVFAYLYGTDVDETGANVGYFFQNQFTGLRDLNALLCGRLMPPLLGDDRAAGAFTGTEPVAQVSLSAPLNSAHRQVRLDTQIRIVAEACFERIYALAAGQMGQAAQRSLTGQDILATFPAEPPGRPERSYRFGALGMRRWEVPTDKLLALLALDLLASALRQMLYQNWQEASGFSHQLAEGPAAEAASAVSGLIGEIEDLRRPAPTADVLAQRLRTALTEQATGLSRAPSAASNGVPLTLRGLEQALAGYYRQHFEQVGVDALVQQRGHELPEKVRDAVRRLELHLTRLWLSGVSPLALARIPQVIDELAARLRRELDAGPALDAGGEHRQRLIEARRHEWDKLTWLAGLTGRSRALIEAHGSDCSAVHEMDLRSRLGLLDRTFVKDLLGRLTTVANRFRSVQQALQRMLDAVQQERDLIDRELRNLHRDLAANKYELDPAALDAFMTWMRRHRAHQDATAFVLREEIGRAIGGTGSLSALDEADLPAIEDRLRREARKQAGLIHQDYKLNRQGRPILEDSVLDILEQRQREDRPAFLAELQDFLGQAAVCLHLRNDVQPMLLHGAGVGVPQMPKRLLLIGLPRHAFTQTLQQDLRAAMPAGQDRVLEAFEHDDPGQIRLLTLDYWLAARFSTMVKALADKYRETAAGGRSTDTHYFCNIDPDGEQGLRPDLFLPSDAEMRLRYEAELWLGQQEGIAVVVADDNGVFLIREDRDGRHPEPLGRTPEDALASADYVKMFALHGRLGEVLAGFDRQELAALLQRQRARIDKEQGLTSEGYRRWDQMLQLLKPLVD